MKICFIDNTKFKYSYLDKHSPLLRGAETILINLTENLKMLGHEVTVFNNCSDDVDNNSSNWFNINKVNKQMNFDIAVANADMRLLDTITAKKKFIISYSLQSIEKFLRKGQLISYFKNKPTILLIGKYHMKNRSKLLSLFGSKIIDIAIDDLFLNTKLTNNIDSNLAIFTSRPDRNLDILIKIWSENILPNFKNAKLLTTPTKTISQSSNIIFRKMDSQENLIKDLLRSKVFLAPGHKAELFCLAAEEARELCLPIVTLGIGSLSERVTHEKTGFIAKNNKDFADYTIELFKNNELWNSIRANLINLRGSSNWKSSTKVFLDSVS
tara:strand:+ start:283 stop:1260 length:978 start_codon:yes stop_codon:yes gene_type:complete